jgi:hypothetical protein
MPRQSANDAQIAAIAALSVLARQCEAHPRWNFSACRQLPSAIACFRAAREIVPKSLKRKEHFISPAAFVPAAGLSFG